MDRAALGDLDAGAGRRQRERHIGHRDRRPQRRREAARGDLADLRSVAVEHRGAFAHRLAPVDAQPDTLDDRALLALDQDTRGTGEIRFLAPPLASNRAPPMANDRGPPMYDRTSVG